MSSHSQHFNFETNGQQQWSTSTSPALTPSSSSTPQSTYSSPAFVLPADFDRVHLPRPDFDRPFISPSFSPSSHSLSSSTTMHQIKLLDPPLSYDSFVEHCNRFKDDETWSRNKKVVDQHWTHKKKIFPDKATAYNYYIKCVLPRAPRTPKRSTPRSSSASSQLGAVTPHSSADVVSVSSSPSASPPSSQRMHLTVDPPLFQGYVSSPHMLHPNGHSPTTAASSSTSQPNPLSPPLPCDKPDCHCHDRVQYERAEMVRKVQSLLVREHERMLSSTFTMLTSESGQGVVRRKRHALEISQP
jgi:hypothetical protein